MQYATHECVGEEFYLGKSKKVCQGAITPRSSASVSSRRTLTPTALVSAGESVETFPQYGEMVLFCSHSKRTAVLEELIGL